MPSDDAPDSGIDPPLACLQAGDLACSEAAPCCNDSLCITDGVTVACAALCTGGDQCVSGCCAPVDEANSVCAPVDFCPPPVEQCTADIDCDTLCCVPIDGTTSACAPTTVCVPPPVICTDLELRGADGVFLGVATSNAFATDGVCNTFSAFGSEFSATSIFNNFGTYGSAFSTLSAYSTLTFTPPVLFCATTATQLNAVSKNTLIIGAVDPDALCSVLAANGL